MWCRGGGWGIVSQTVPVMIVLVVVAHGMIGLFSAMASATGMAVIVRMSMARIMMP